MDTSDVNDYNTVLKFIVITKQLDDLKKNCKHEALSSIYKVTELFFKNISKSNACLDFLEYVDLIQSFLKFPENVRLAIVKLLSKKPVKYPGRIFNDDEILLIKQNSDEISKFINFVPEEKVSLHFLISNTLEHERIEYYQSITQETVQNCSVEGLMMIVTERIKEENLNATNVFNYFFNLIKGAYRINFSTYRMFSSIVMFMYSNNISKLNFLSHNIIDLYINKSVNKSNMPNIELLEKSKLLLFTNISMLYFGILNSNHIMIADDRYSVYMLDEVIKYYQILLSNGSFNQFNEKNFSNSAQFILFKCMNFMANIFIPISKFEIAKELFEAIIDTFFFTKIPKFLQCKFLFDYCIVLKRMNKIEKVLSISKKFCKNLKQLPLYYAVSFYNLYIEQKSFKKNRKHHYRDDDFLPILEGTVEGTLKRNNFHCRSLYTTVINDLKSVTKCSKGCLFNKNLWNEVCILLLFDQLKNEEIESFFFTENFCHFSKNQIIYLLKSSCKLLLNLKTKNSCETISSNYDLYTKFVKEQSHGNVNFKTISDYISFVNCFDIKDMIKLMTYMLKNPFRQLNQEFFYLWDTNKKKCYAVHLEESNQQKPLKLKQRCAFYILKKLLRISCYSIQYTL